MGKGDNRKTRKMRRKKAQSAKKNKLLAAMNPAAKAKK